MILKLIHECSDVFLKAISLRSDTLMVNHDKFVSGVNHEHNSLLRVNVRTQVVEVRNVKPSCPWSVAAKLYKKMECTSVIGYHFSNYNVEYISRSKAGSQEL